MRTYANFIVKNKRAGSGEALIRFWLSSFSMPVLFCYATARDNIRFCFKTRPSRPRLRALAINYLDSACFFDAFFCDKLFARARLTFLILLPYL